MELDRRAIERQDFPNARRGYDPAEVDRHLRAIATAVEELKSTRSQSSTSLAGAAAERVESIVAAAEASAREIEQKAQADAKATREEADREAAERVAKAESMVSDMATRAQELKTEIDDFVARVAGLKTAVDTIRREFDDAAPAASGEAALEFEDTAIVEPEPEQKLDLDRLE